VRVGGLVAAVSTDRFRLDDGTAIAAIHLRGAAADLGSSIVVGDALSAIGRVEADPADGTMIVAVDDPAGIALVGGLGGEPSTDPNASAGTPDDSAGAAASDAPASALAAGLGDPAIPEVSVVGVVLISLASLLVTLLRRQRTQRRFAARIAARLDAVVRSAGTGSTTVTGSQPGRNVPAAPDDPGAVVR
jgi:hypothetical protein